MSPALRTRATQNCQRVMASDRGLDDPSLLQRSRRDLVEGEAEQRGPAGGEPAEAHYSGADEVGDRVVGGVSLPTRVARSR